MNDIKECPKCKRRSLIINMIDKKYRCIDCGYIQEKEESSTDIVIDKIKNGAWIIKFPKK